MHVKLHQFITELKPTLYTRFGITWLPLIVPAICFGPSMPLPMPAIEQFFTVVSDEPKYV
jgi:hypothetical protein